MNDYELPDEYYWEQQEREEIERQRQQEMDMEEIIHASCPTLCELVYVSVKWEHGIARYYESYNCQSCGMWREYSIDYDDFLYRKNQGYEIRT